MRGVPAVRAIDVQKRFGRVQALAGVSFDVQPAALFALLGPNGAGKTTMMHILCTLHAADQGDVEVFGQSVRREPRRVRRNLGVVFQEPSLDGRLTCFENLDFHGRVYGVPGSVRRRRIDEVLELVELADWRNALVRTLSRGMQRRLELARALVHDSRLLVLDEPTVGLDAHTRERIWSYLAELRAVGERTMIVSTHYIDEVDACDDVCIIDEGRVLAHDAPSALKRRHGRTFVHVEVDSDEVAGELDAAYDASITPTGPAGRRIELASDEAIRTFVARFGTRVSRFGIERPSLETVFLGLTGRDLRDEAAGPRDRLYAFGQRGGEHTR